MTSLAELTGFADGPPIELSPALAGRIRDLGRRAGVDAEQLITERAEIWSYTRNGTVSCGGAARLLPAADGWLAVSLPRPDDLELVPAWIGCDATWEAVTMAVPESRVVDLVSRGRLLGLPVAAMGERAPGPAYRSRRVGDADALSSRDAPLVVDLSSLWAGPLCTRLLRSDGARVIKVESRARPDGARRGPKEFFDRMHEGKEFVSIDFTREELLPLLAQADVVVEGSRPRALDQLGIARVGPRVWLSITAHGRRGEPGNWVGFGDDCAVAGGLVAHAENGTPVFIGDAIADPLAGIAGAIAVRRALHAGGRWLIDCNLAGVAAYVAGST